MNAPFFEFWGKFLTNVAKGQKQLDDMSTWMKKGYADADDLAALFRRCYGLDKADAGNQQNLLAWKEAVAGFQNTFAQFAAQWGWVTQSEHQKVRNRCAALEKEVQEQQTTIRHLRELLAQKGLGYNELLLHMQGSLKNQSEQFQTLMENIRSAFNDKP
jgi:DNA anti-recombination protein RmuC